MFFFLFNLDYYSLINYSHPSFIILILLSKCLSLSGPLKSSFLHFQASMCLFARGDLRKTSRISLNLCTTLFNNTVLMLVLNVYVYLKLTTHPEKTNTVVKKKWMKAWCWFRMSINFQSEVNFCVCVCVFLCHSSVVFLLVCSLSFTWQVIWKVSRRYSTFSDCSFLRIHRVNNVFTVTEFKCAKMSRLQEVYLDKSDCFLSWWKMVHFDPQERLEYEGLPVPVSLRTNTIKYIYWQLNAFCNMQWFH